MAPNGYQTAVHPNQPSDQAAAASTPGTATYNQRSPYYDSTLDRGSPNYIPPASTSDTGAEVHGRAEDRVSAEDAATNDEIWGIRELINRFTHDGRVNEQYSQEMDAQARELAAAGGQTRQGPMMACSNYMAWPHNDLKRMVNEDADPGGVGTAGDQWINAGNAMVEFQDQVRTAINSSEADWQGASGNRARGFMADVGNWVGSTGTQAQLAGTQTNRASTSLSAARDTMPEEVPYDAAKAMQDYNDAFWPWDKKAISDQAWADYRASEEAHQRAAQVVGTYDANLSGASTMPAFGPPPMMAGDPGEQPPKPPPGHVGPFPPEGGGPNPPGGGPGGGPGGYNPPPGGGGPGGSGLPGTGGSGPGGLPGGSGYPGGTNPGGAGAGRPGGSGGAGGPGGPGSGGPGDGGFPGMPIGGGPFPGGFGNDFERGGGGGRGPGVGARGFGPGGTGGFGPGGSGPGSGGSGPGMGRGPGGMGPGGAGGAGALAAEHAAGGGRGPGGGRGGAGGPMGGMGGGRGQGEEDGEHQRPSYLVEADPESLFGTDEMTAPPVIGE